MAIYSMAGEKLSYSKDLKGHVRKNVFSTFFFFFFKYRIERLWRDLFMSVTGVYYNILHSLEDEHLLDISNVLHIFCCHYVFLPRIQASLDVFSDAWDNHPIRTEQNLTPNQLWQVGQALNPVADPDSEVNNALVMLILNQLKSQMPKNEGFSDS